MSESQNRIDEIIRRADAVKPEERRRYSDVREMRADIAQRLQAAARELPHVQNNLDMMRARATAAEAELREARATIERLESVILSSAGRMFDKNGGAGVPLGRLLAALDGDQ